MKLARYVLLSQRFMIDMRHLLVLIMNSLVDYANQDLGLEL